MDALDLAPLFFSQILQVADTERCGDHTGGGASHSIRDKAQVVGALLPVSRSYMVARKCSRRVSPVQLFPPNV